VYLLQSPMSRIPLKRKI